MRRLADDEMASLVRLCRDGRKGPGRALEALWELIVRDADQVGVAEAAARTPTFRVHGPWTYTVTDTDMSDC